MVNSREIKKRNKKYAQGSITVYCTLVLLLMLALIGSLLESAHQSGVRTRIEQAASVGLDSLLSMYDAGLYEQYGLLFLNEDLLESSVDETLYGYMDDVANPNSGLLIKTPQLLSFSVESVDTDVYYANDDSGVFLEREVLELMKYQEAATLVSSLGSYIEQITNADSAYSYVVEKNEEYESTDWGELAESLEDEDEESDTDEDPDEDSDGDSDGDSDDDSSVTNEDVESSLDGSIITQVEELLTDSLLSLFVSDVSELSENSSSYSVSFGNDHGIELSGGVLSDTTSTVLYDEYLLQYMGSYTSPATSEGLSYELEYIICGGMTDKENLLSLTTKLLLTRMGLNIVFLLTNSSYSSQAESLATTLVGWTGLVALVTAVKLLLIAVWAFCESVLDVRALLQGKKVAFYKSSQSWTTGISDCVTKVASGSLAKESDSGLGYDTYLRMYLLMQGMEEKLLRTMTVIEWNMKGQGRDDFSLSDCIYAVEVEAEFKSKPVFYSLYGSLAGVSSYGYNLVWSQTY